MKNQRKFLFVLWMALVTVLYGSTIFAAAPNTCVTCHANESLMKSMYKPPVLPPGEGEG